MADKVVLAYSGGLDTSAAIPWIKEKYGLDVIALTVDVGNQPDFQTITEKAKNAGAIKTVVRDVQQEFVSEFVFPALKAGVIYEGHYTLATALARPLIARTLVTVAREEGAAAVSHGCTGKGNDQVRFDVSVTALAPDLKIVAPAREWGMTREATIEYSQRHNIPIPVTVDSPYSIDSNLYGKSIECGILEDPWTETPEEIFTWTKSPADAPDTPGYVEISFERGIPVSLDSEAMDGISLIQKLNKLAGEHGVGRTDMVENRLVGIKSREVYEAPAAVTLLTAHQALEALTLSKNQVRFQQMVSATYADLIYNGLWFGALRRDLAAYVDSSQQSVSGTVRMKLFKGSCRAVGRKSPQSLYQYNLATYDKGDQFDQSASPGFIHIWGLPLKVQQQVQQLNAEGKGD